MIPPPSTALTPARSASSPRSPSQASRGPHAGQATGSAWKRRSAGSAYSAAQSAHSGKQRMVVRIRSYGRSSMIVARGPQSVQLMNG